MKEAILKPIALFILSMAGHKHIHRMHQGQTMFLSHRGYPLNQFLINVVFVASIIIFRDFKKTGERFSSFTRFS